MAGLLYYVPNRQSAQLSDLPELDLAHAFEKNCSPRGVINNGPDGGAGVILADSTRVPNIGHYRDRQEWIRIPGNPAGAWVGRYTDSPVEPKDLQRDEMLSGHEVRLADGRDWLVPIARAWGEFEGEVGWCKRLPQKTTLDEDGNWTTGEVVERYAEIWSTVCQFWDALLDGDSEDAESEDAGQGAAKIQFDFPGIRDAALQILTVNYRLGKAEVALLGLFESGTSDNVLMATIDWPGFEALSETLSKKKQETEASPAAGD